MKCIWPIRSTLAALVVVTSLQGRAAPPGPVDIHGDPLPPGAVARCGTTRLLQPGCERLAFSPDGRVLACRSGNGSLLRLWDVPTGARLAEIDLTSRGVGGCDLQFAPDGRFYISCRAGLVEVWNGRAATWRIALPGSFSHRTAAFSPDGKVIAVGDDEGRIQLVSRAESKPRVLRSPDAGAEPSSHAWSVSFSPDGELLAATDHKGRLEMWDVKTEKMARAGNKEELAWLSFSPDGRFLATLDRGPKRQVFLRQARTGKPLAPFEPIELGASGALRYTADGKRLLTVNGRELRQHDAVTGKLLAARMLPPEYNPPGFGRDGECFSPDGRLLAITTGPRLLVLSVQTARSIHGGLEVINSPAWARVVGDSVWVGEEGPTVHRWALRTGKRLPLPTVPEGQAILDFHPDGKFLLTWSRPDDLFLRSADGKRPLWTGPGTSAPAASHFSPCGRLLATPHAAGLTVLDLATLRERRVGDCAPDHLSWSADGRMLALPYAERKQVMLFEVGTGRVRDTIPTGAHAAVVFSPDRKHLVVRELMRGDVAVHRLGRKGPLFDVLARAPGAANRGSIRYSPDGRYLATACLNDVRVWDAEGRPLARLAGHEAYVQQVMFSPDGRFLVSTSTDGTALVWDATAFGIARGGTGVKVDPTKVWDDLAANDARRAFKAMAWLRDRPALAVLLLSRRVLPGNETADPAERRLQLRAVEVLESVGSAGSRDVLRNLSTTAVPWLRAEARASLGRLEKGRGR